LFDLRSAARLGGHMSRFGASALLWGVIVGKSTLCRQLLLGGTPPCVKDRKVLILTLVAFHLLISNFGTQDSMIAWPPVVVWQASGAVVLRQNTRGGGQRKCTHLCQLLRSKEKTPDVARKSGGRSGDRSDARGAYALQNAKEPLGHL